VGGVEEEAVRVLSRSEPSDRAGGEGFIMDGKGKEGLEKEHPA